MTEYERINRQFENIFFPKVNKAINKKVVEVIQDVKRDGIDSAISSLNKNLTNPELTEQVTNLYKSVGLRHANRVTRDLRRQKAFGFNAEWVAWIIEYLREHFIENIVFGVNTTTRNRLLTILNKSIEEGWGVDKTVSKLEDFPETQAARIVRTEVNTAANAGVLAAGETYEYEMQKEWISVHDFRTRGNNPEDHASHVLLNGTVIDFDDEFTDPRNGDKLKSPGDPDASPESIINCRCNIALKPKRDPQGRLIPKTRISVIRNFNRPQRTVVI